LVLIFSGGIFNQRIHPNIPEVWKKAFPRYLGVAGKWTWQLLATYIRYYWGGDLVGCTQGEVRRQWETERLTQTNKGTNYLVGNSPHTEQAARTSVTGVRLGVPINLPWHPTYNYGPLICMSNGGADRLMDRKKMEHAHTKRQTLQKYSILQQLSGRRGRITEEVLYRVKKSVWTFFQQTFESEDSLEPPDTACKMTREHWVNILMEN
jgi:hypothetical protein